MRHLRFDERMQLRMIARPDIVMASPRSRREHGASANVGAIVVDVVSASHRRTRRVARLAQLGQASEIVVQGRTMQYAKYHDRKNSKRESLIERDSTILSRALR
jgi:hypothetical protein